MRRTISHASFSETAGRGSPTPCRVTAIWPMPSPIISRPSEISSIEPASIAITAGWRAKGLTMPKPILIFSVACAIAAQTVIRPRP